LEDPVNQPVFKAFDQLGTPGAPSAPTSAGVVLPFIQPSTGVTGEIVNAICELRRHRQDCFPGTLFGDPTWDMLLQLYAAHLDSLRMSITRLTRSTALPATTVLRRLGLLEKGGLVVRAGDPFDARRVFVGLSPSGIEAMDRCFAASGLRVALL
jgi:winged helix DNA-binding protein